MTDHSETANMAIFCDYENVAIGVREARYEEFDIRLCLQRLLDKGKVVHKRAYADWDRYKQAKRGMHEAAFEMVEIPHVSYSGKNSADIRLVVDALDLCWSKKHVNTFVIISGDSDFSPLVSKLRENDKRVIGMGVKSSSGHLLIDNCDEFIYYDDLVRERTNARRAAAGSPAKSQPNRADAKPNDPATQPAKPTGPADLVIAGKSLEDRQREGLDMVLDVVEALFRDRDGALHGSLVKETLKRKRPEFSERFHGYRTFSDLLQDAKKRALLEVSRDERSGGFVVTAFGAKA
ncbi:MAG: NYN domain-containing protein [Deltaproteobacteria bacterium]|nr:NYN domain-containing protein [Deltaproteobacteria bacterium]